MLFCSQTNGKLLLQSTNLFFLLSYYFPQILQGFHRKLNEMIDFKWLCEFALLLLFTFHWYLSHKLIQSVNVILMQFNQCQFLNQCKLFCFKASYISQCEIPLDIMVLVVNISLTDLHGQNYLVPKSFSIIITLFSIELKKYY